MKKIIILFTLLTFSLNANLDLSKVMSKNQTNFLIANIKSLLENNNSGIEVFDPIDEILNRACQENPGLRIFLINNKSKLISLKKDWAKKYRPEIYKNLTQEELNSKLIEIIIDRQVSKSKEAERLIMAGADPNLIIEIGQDRYPLVVYICKFNIFSNLLDLFKIYNININAQADNGCTALMVAFNCEKPLDMINMVNKVINLDPNLSIKDNYEHNALTYALKSKIKFTNSAFLSLIKKIIHANGIDQKNNNLLLSRRDYRYF